MYGRATGTSDSTAFVSATAALVRAKYPELSAGQVINRLIKSASFAHHKGLKAPDEEYGYGIVRPYSALTMDIPAGPKANPPRPPDPTRPAVPRPGQGHRPRGADLLPQRRRDRGRRRSPADHGPDHPQPPHPAERDAPAHDGRPLPAPAASGGLPPLPQRSPPARLHTAPGPTAAQP
ncbi:S8 family serine peptidase [Streptomyces nigra]|uniref:S8 family serine peptidase n=1 Tax=Streptomyces nigra TaxID=1827580 RepID=UPI003630121C